MDAEKTLQPMEHETAQPLTKKQRRALKREERLQTREIQTKRKLQHRILLWGGVGVGLIAMVFGLMVFSRQSKETTSPSLQNEGDLSVQEGEWTKGNQEAPVTLIEYSDFQCPACKNYSPLLKRLHEEFQGDLRIVYRHFPLSSIHRNAEKAAQATEAAGIQGKFWEMHDKIFDGQDVWKNQWNPENTFIQYSQELNLNIDQFKSDLKSKEVTQAVKNDIDAGNRLAIHATPTFFLNKKQLQNPPSYEGFVRLIRAEIEFSKTTQPSSTPEGTETPTPQIDFKEEEQQTLPLPSSNAEEKTP